MDPTDAELIQRVLSADPAAERELYERHVDAVYRIAFRLSGDSDAAADYTQDAFIKAFGALPQFRGECAFSTWMRTIAASVIMTGEKRRARYGRDAIDPARLIDERSTSRQSAFEFTDRVAQALDRMSVKLQTVFLMHDVEGYTHQEIGAALGIPAGTSKARLSDARAKLRAALADYAKDRAS